MRSSAGKIRLTGFDDLFQTTGEAQDNGEQVQYVPLSELFPFKNHPFQVRDNEAMQKTVESIAQRGVLSPAIVRPRREGGYEIIAGHRRKRGSELAGRETMPVLVRALDDDEATIIMVDSNLQREKILPSEKAFAYKMKLYHPLYTLVLACACSPRAARISQFSCEILCRVMRRLKGKNKGKTGQYKGSGNLQLRPFVNMLINNSSLIYGGAVV